MGSSNDIFEWARVWRPAYSLRSRTSSFPAALRVLGGGDDGLIVNVFYAGSFIFLGCKQTFCGNIFLGLVYFYPGSALYLGQVVFSRKLYLREFMSGGFSIWRILYLEELGVGELCPRIVC